MPLTLQVLLALVAGLALGLGLSGSSAPAAQTILAVLGPVGTLFINAIRMTVIPLVTATLIVGVGSAPDARAVGRLGLRSVAIFVVVLALASAVGVLMGAWLLGSFSFDAATVEAMRSTAAEVSSEGGRVPTIGEWLVGLVPVNPIKAAADGAMLPLILFSVLFAAALSRVAEDRRTAVLRVFEGIQDASLILVRAILALAPVGVFALAVPLAARMGLAAAGALVVYIGVVSAICVGFMLFVLYPAAVVFGKVRLREFIAASLPAQGIAFSSRSSLAALPAMLDSVRRTLKLPPSIGSFFIPLAASMFRAGAGIGQTVGVLFIAKLYGVDLDAAQLATIAVTSVITSFSVPGVPGGSILVMVPVLMAAGIPIEGIGILLGVDTIPDMFRTTTNVTGHMAAAVIVARGEAPADSSGDAPLPAAAS
ncbi:MAG: dicarboxylate/amino acid:cation symporter [Gemmatimonadaceae bacterium]|nr:dicarboxylate/amino acid:cation symporter [Gemmatimonadaceae bacterium]MCW5826544.1 dicarboxylate/amino acid:cation symporter [Gemmatimonadaceae bacterium]